MPEVFSLVSETTAPHAPSPETFAHKLTVVVRSYAYVGLLVPGAQAAVQVLTGGAPFPQCPSFA